MAGALRLVLGDQLSDNLSALADADLARDQVLMVESRVEATAWKHHKQKLVIVWSAMRQFAERLRARGFDVRYVALEDPGNTGSISDELRRALEAGAFDRVVRTACGKWGLENHLLGLELPVPMETREDDRFLCSRAQFAAWAEGRRELRMEFFYREMRRKTGLLMDGDQPAGGRWNFDAENRRKLPPGLRPPERLRIPPNPTTRRCSKKSRAASTTISATPKALAGPPIRTRPQRSSTTSSPTCCLALATGRTR